MDKIKILRKLEKLSVELSRVRVLKIVTGGIALLGFLSAVGAVGTEDLYTIEHVAREYSDNALLIQEIVGTVIFGVFAWFCSSFSRSEDRLEDRIFFYERRLLRDEIEELD